MTHRFGIRVFSWMLGLIFLSFLGIPAARAQTESGEKIYQRLLKSTVWVVVPTGKDPVAGKIHLRTGSGSLVDASRKLVLTNYHVVGNADSAIVLFPVYQHGKAVAERSYYLAQVREHGGIRGKVIAKDTKCDLALVQLEKITEDAKAVPLARSSVSPGQDVHSVGNPGSSGALWVYTPGKVRQVYHKRWTAGTGKERLDLDAQIVETQSSINAGDSGGPLVNNKGELVAVTQGHVVDAQQVSFFIDIKEVRGFLASHKLLAGLSPSSSSNPSGDRSDTRSENASEKTEDAAAKAERLAAQKLRFAKEFAEKGKLETAKDYCEDILAAYPNTKAAGEAKLLLEKLNK